MHRGAIAGVSAGAAVSTCTAGKLRIPPGLSKCLWLTASWNGCGIVPSKPPIRPMDADTEFQPFAFESSDLIKPQTLEDAEKGSLEFIGKFKAGTCYPRIGPRIPRHVAALEDLAGKCRAAIEGFGLWREDGLDFDEVCDLIRDQVESNLKELENDDASSLALDNQKLAECKPAATSVLASEQYLSGAELEVLHDVVAGEIFDTRRLSEIAGNHGRWLKVMD